MRPLVGLCNFVVIRTVASLESGVQKDQLVFSLGAVDSFGIEKLPFYRRRGVRLHVGAVALSCAILHFVECFDEALACGLRCGTSPVLPQTRGGSCFEAEVGDAYFNGRGCGRSWRIPVASDLTMRPHVRFEMSTARGE